MQLVAVPVDGTTEDRITWRSGDSGLCQDEFARWMARMDGNRDVLDGQRRHVIIAVDADDQERQQFAQVGGLSTQECQNSQKTKGATGLVEQLGTAMGGAVGVRKARKHQEGLRRQCLQIRYGHALERAQHPEGNPRGVQHPYPAGVAVIPVSLFRVEVIDVFRRPP